MNSHLGHLRWPFDSLRDALGSFVDPGRDDEDADRAVVMGVGYCEVGVVLGGVGQEEGLGAEEGLLIPRAVEDEGCAESVEMVVADFHGVSPAAGEGGGGGRGIQ